MVVREQCLFWAGNERRNRAFRGSRGVTHNTSKQRLWIAAPLQVRQSYGSLSGETPETPAQQQQ